MSKGLCIPLFLVFCLGNITCTTVRYAKGQSIEISEEYLGICPTIRLDHRELDLIESIGAEWIRHDFPWDTIENIQDVWAFDHWDGYVQRAKGRQRNILAILDYDVPWIHEDSGARPYITQDKLPYYLTYVEKVAQRYGDNVSAFEVWNEPNTRRFWKGPRTEFFQLIEETIRAVKTNAPDTKIVAGAVLGSPVGYLKDMLESGVLNQVNVISFHPYALNPGRVMRKIDIVRSLTSEYGFSGELWITEVGFPGWDSGSRSEIRQAEYAVKILVGAAIRNISQIFWYELLDPDPTEQIGMMQAIENHFGIARFDFTPKAAFHAYSLVGRFVPASRYAPDCIEIEPSLAGKIEVLPFVKPDGTVALFLWAKRKQTIQLLFEGNVKDPVEHQLTSGEIRPFRQVERLELTRKPKLVTFLSMEDPVTVKVVRAKGGSQ